MRLEPSRKDVAIGLVVVSNRDQGWLDARSVLRRQVLAHLGEQLARAKWFGDIRVAAGSTGLGLVSTQGIRCHSNDRNGFELSVALDAPRRFIPIHRGQLNVHEDEVRTRAQCQGDPILAIDRFDQVVAGVAQQVAAK